MKIIASIIASAGLALGGCTMATPIPGPNGQKQVLVECGASTPFSNCYKRANAECPKGYQVLDEMHGFNRASLRVACDA